MAEEAEVEAAAAGEAFQVCILDDRVATAVVSGGGCLGAVPITHLLTLHLAVITVLRPTFS